MTKSAHDYARELATIVDASANALATLSRVLLQQQQSILVLASEAGVPAPAPAGTASTPHSVDAKATSPAPATNTAPSTVAAPGAASPTTLSPEALLAQAEQAAHEMIAHSPEVAIAHLYQASSHAVSLALINTVTAQQQLAIVAQAVVTRGAANQLSAPRAPALPPRAKAAAVAPPGSTRGQAQHTRAR